jgi:hypothetical protein
LALSTSTFRTCTPRPHGLRTSVASCARRRRRRRPPPSRGAVSAPAPLVRRSDQSARWPATAWRRMARRQAVAGQRGPPIRASAGRQRERRRTAVGWRRRKRWRRRQARSAPAISQTAAAPCGRTGASLGPTRAARRPAVDAASPTQRASAGPSQRQSDVTVVCRPGPAACPATAPAGTADAVARLAKLGPAEVERSGAGAAPAAEKRVWQKLGR